MDYSKYKFNYFDVVKRHERIINRPKDWEIKILAIIMLVVTFVYTFTSFAFCSTEVLPFSVNSWAISGSTITESSNRKVYQYNVMPKNKYNLITDGGTPQIIVRKSDGSVIELGDDVLTLLTASGLSDVSFEVPDGVYYIGILTNNDNNMSLFLETDGYQNAVNNLSDNVGINQMWGVFENGIDFVGVVVLVAFGLFLVVLAIRKISKGKSEF